MIEKRPESPILLVEDNPDDIELAYRLFERCSMANDVWVVKDGQQALDYVFGSGVYAGQGIARSLRLILLDLDLPKIAGIEVLRRLKADERTRSIPVVVLTISGKERDALEKGSLGISDYLRKPFDFHLLLNLYHSYVKKP